MSDPLTPHPMAQLIESTLGNPSTELAIRSQILALAQRNLHLPAVLGALVDVLPKLKDSETKRGVLDLLLARDPSRFPDLKAFYAQVLALLKTERERDYRVTLLTRLGQSLHQDETLPLAFIDLLQQPDLSEPEREVILGALGDLPSVSEDLALALLGKTAHAPGYLQVLGLDIAEGCPTWTQALCSAAVPLLGAQVQREIRLRVFAKLKAARALDGTHAPMLIEILRTETDAAFRREALELFATLQPWTSAFFTQLLWSSRHDRDETIRARAVELQRQAPELSTAETENLARQLFEDASPEVRVAVLDALQPYLRDTAVRTALAQSFAVATQATQEEFERLTTALLPYSGREPAIRAALLATAANDSLTERRLSLLQKLLPRLRMEENLPWVVARFSRERHEAIRELLFTQVKALSVARHPDLIALFANELREPSSAFRVHCAAALAPVVETSPDALAAIEDVLFNDQDRELVRIALNAYLKPGVTPRFAALLVVVGTETLDLASRKLALERITRLPLDEGEQQQLATTLTTSSLKS